MAVAGSAALLLGYRNELPDLASIADGISAKTGLQLAYVDIRGHRHASAHEITAALAIERGTPMFRIDLEAARLRVVALPWIRSAALHRVLPDGLRIEITERTPAAVWRLSDRSMLIDGGGHILADISHGADVGLPVLAGAGAGASASAILAALRAHPMLAARMAEARHIAERRWTLVLDTGTLVHLPGDGLDAALAWLGSQMAAGLLDAGLEAVDLRVAGQLVVRRGGSAMPRTALAPSFQARE